MFEMIEGYELAVFSLIALVSVWVMLRVLGINQHTPEEQPKDTTKAQS